MSGQVYSISVFASLVLVASGTTVPRPDNVAACNAEARDAVTSGGSASSGITPNTTDRQRADEARRGDATRSENAQLTGMDPDGAKNPAYQAAYRTCMRRSGF